MAEKKDHFGELLEKYGVRYFAAITALFYVVGTVVFNIYLRKLGSFEFDLLQLRYMFVGLAFIFITALFPLLIATGYGIARLVKNLKSKNQPEPKLTLAEKTKLQKKRNEQSNRTFNRWKWVFIVFLPIWLAFYSWSIFPYIPSGFGGAKPYAARLIGSEDVIRKINDQIAFEAGVKSEKLPFEVLPGASGLTTGANVLILDKSSSRIFLLLTRDLYLSSTSSFAKKMLELGSFSENVDAADTESFKVKPLIVSADGIEGITLSLYEPPEVTTIADLQLAAEIVAANPERAQQVSDAISKDLPGVGEKIVAAVQEHAKPKPTPTDPTAPVEPIQSLEDVINIVIEESVDTTFIDFRALSFSQAAALMEVERRSGISSDRRRVLIQTITDTFKTEFPDAWAELDPTKNFLVIGQTDPDFAKKIRDAFRGAESAIMVMNRLNATEKTEEHPFLEIQMGAKELLENSVQTNTQENREFVAQALRNYFNNQAPRRREFWAGGYMDTGVLDEKFFENITKAFAEPTDWESFQIMLETFESEMDIPVVPVETCDDGIKNQDETNIDCGGTVCDVCVVVPVETCSDGVKNQDETDIDCGGTICDACVIEPILPEATCDDGIKNQDETEIDCGGTICDACVVVPEATCDDGVQNGDETGVDCGGSCPTTCSL
jgi:hypothetical protein